MLNADAVEKPMRLRMDMCGEADMEHLTICHHN